MSENAPLMGPGVRSDSSTKGAADQDKEKQDSSGASDSATAHSGEWRDVNDLMSQLGTGWYQHKILIMCCIAATAQGSKCCLSHYS